VQHPSAPDPFAQQLTKGIGSGARTPGLGWGGERGGAAGAGVAGNKVLVAPFNTSKNKNKKSKKEGLPVIKGGGNGGGGGGGGGGGARQWGGGVEVEEEYDDAMGWGGGGEGGGGEEIGERGVTLWGGGMEERQAEAGRHGPKTPRELGLPRLPRRYES
jgi:hypothetical protein